MRRVLRIAPVLMAALCAFAIAPLCAEATEISDNDTQAAEPIAIAQDTGSNDAGAGEPLETDGSSGDDNSGSADDPSNPSSDQDVTKEPDPEPDPDPEPEPEPVKPVIKSTFDKTDGVWTYYDANGKATAFPKLAPGWVKQENVWYWFPNANSFVRDNWATVGGAKYHFDALGHMQTGWFNVDQKRYFASSSGAMRTGWLAQGSSWYYLDPSGPMVEKNWRYLGGRWYYLAEGGRMATGWFKEHNGKTWYYCNGSGAMLTGWLRMWSTWYYLEPSGAMVERDWRRLGGVWYYLHDGGAMATGWFKEHNGKTWYYCNGSGAMLTGWLRMWSTWYYLDPSGAMAENDWRRLGGVWYYLRDGGAMATGWFKETGKDTWYYANGSGAMQTGWLYVGGTWYYLEPSGAMHTGWVLLSQVWYYLRPVSGAMAVGNVTIDGKVERFDGNGHYRPGLNRNTLIANINALGGARRVTVTGGSIPASALALIEADIAAIEAQGGSCGVVLVDLTSGTIISSNAWQKYYAASSIKGSYVCAVAASNPGGAGSYAGTISSTLSWSSNTDYKRLRQVFGGGPMASYMAQAGVSSFSPYDTWVDMSAADQAKLWVRNYDYLSEASGAAPWLEGNYRHTSMSFIDQALGGAYNVYSKAGWIWNGRGSRYHVYDDGGFVEKGDRPYVIAVMSSANATDQGRLAQLVRHLDAAQSQIVRS